MPGRRTEADELGFGARLAALRKAAGYTQLELAEEVGLSQRMMAYYESPRARPPTDVLPALAQALGVSIETLLGTGPMPKATRTKNTRLERRLKEIERLGAREKRQILQILDTFLDREKLRRRVSNGAERTA
jgi:transcriptional regulator with XRE-family HTH domain